MNKNPQWSHLPPEFSFTREAAGWKHLGRREPKVQWIRVGRWRVILVVEPCKWPFHSLYIYYICHNWGNPNYLLSGVILRVVGGWVSTHLISVCSSKMGIFPRYGVKIKNDWDHHLVMSWISTNPYFEVQLTSHVFYFQPYTLWFIWCSSCLMIPLFHGSVALQKMSVSHGIQWDEQYIYINLAKS